MTKKTLITQSQVEATKKVVETYIHDERTNVEEYLYDEGVDDDLDSMTDEEFYEKYHADYEHIWFDLYLLSQIK